MKYTFSLSCPYRQHKIPPRTQRKVQEWEPGYNLDALSRASNMQPTTQYDAQ